MSSIVAQSGLEIFSLISNLLGSEHGGGWACPWCAELGEYETRDREQSDRLFISTRIVEGRHPLRFTCRYANEGLVSHHPVHSIEELVTYLTEDTLQLAPGKDWETVAQEVLALVGKGSGRTDVDPSKAFWDFERAYSYHTAGGNAWEEMGFSPATVKRLILGKRGNRLTIPIPYLAPDEQGTGLVPTDSYVQRTRRADTARSGPKYYWPEGLSPSLWYIPQLNKKENSPVRLVEGDTSAIAALDIWGDGPIATTTGGAGTWTDAMAEYLIAKGHTEFHIYYDNDSPGLSYAQRILKSLQRVGGDGLTVLLVLWPDETPEGTDPRSMLNEYGAERARVLLDQWVAPNGWFSMRQPNHGRMVAEWDQVYATTEYAQDVEDEMNKLTDLATLRGDGPGSIYAEIEAYADNYKMSETGEGTLLLIRSTPGTGKTRAAVRFAERWAKDYAAKRLKSVQTTIQRLLARDDRTEAENEQLERLQSGNYKKHSVLFVGPFIDGFDDIMNHSEYPELWYNLEARNTTNCKNLSFVNRLANAGYEVMTSLCIEGGACPFRQQCLGIDENGVTQYMAQLDMLKQYPIIYARHNHLYMKSLMKQAQVIIVDEDPSSVALGSTTLYASDVKKLDPYIMLEAPDAVHVKRLIDALCNAIEGWQHEARYLSGRALVDYIDILDGPYTLHQIAQYIVEYGLLEAIAEWSPGTEDEVDRAPDGRIVALLGLIVRDILRDTVDWNGQVFIENGMISFYPMEPFETDPHKRIIALDATGIKQKYELCFNRSVMEFHAEVYPANARTIVITNTESTMNTLLSDVGTREEMVATHGQRESVKTAAALPVADFAIFEDTVEMKNPAMRDFLKLSLGLTHRHGRLLIVTYKTARIFAERFFAKNFPEYYDRMAFGHFRALRGLNTFEDMPAVLVAGTPRVPPSILRRDLSAIYKDDDELLDLKIARVYEYYHLTPWKYSTMKLSDQRTHPLIDELEAGEIQQVAGRIRAAVHDDPRNPKHIYLLTARPAMRWHSYYGPTGEPEGEDLETDISFITMQKALWLYVEAEQSVSLIRKYMDEFNRVPSIRKLAEWAGISKHKAIKIRQHWDENFT